MAGRRDREKDPKINAEFCKKKLRHWQSDYSIGFVIRAAKNKNEKNFIIGHDNDEVN